jgi:hypothetical protein
MSSEQSVDGTERPKVMRNVIQEPSEGTAGFGIAHIENPPPHQMEYQIEQFWPDGDVETVYIGDSEDALRLIAELTEVVRRDQLRT